MMNIRKTQTADRRLQQQCKQFAIAECANMKEGKCIPEDCACHLIHPRYASIQDGALNCDWFFEAVLPAFPELYEEVMAQLMLPLNSCSAESEKECLCCGAPFLQAGNRQLYCSECRKTVRLKNARKRWALKKGGKTK